MKSGYKQTEVGLIPQGWDVFTVRQMGEVVTGKALAVSAPGKQRPYLRTKNVFDGRIDIQDVLTMPMTDEQFAQFQIRSGDVLLNEGQSLELVGRCSLYSDEYPEPCAIQNQLVRFRARKGVSAVFASYLFRRCQEIGVFARIALQTTSIAHLGGSRFERLRLAWPKTEDEQRAIASALSDVDRLLDGLDRLIAKKRDLKQAVMQQLLTQQTRLPGFHGEWHTKTLRKLIKEIGDGATPSTSNPRNFGGGINWVVIDDIKDEIVTTATTLTQRGLQSCAATLWPPGTLILSTGATIGEVGIARISVATKQGICGLVFHPTEAIATFMKYWFTKNKPILLGKAQGSTIKEVRAPTLVEIELNIPPVPEQTAIAEVLTEMDADLAALEQRRAKTRAIKQAMMQELLTGRIRLV